MAQLAVALYRPQEFSTAGFHRATPHPRTFGNSREMPFQVLGGERLNGWLFGAARSHAIFNFMPETGPKSLRKLVYFLPKLACEALFSGGGFPGCLLGRP